MFDLIVGAQIDDGKSYIQFCINKHSQYNYQVFTDCQTYPRRCRSYELFSLSLFLKVISSLVNIFSQKNFMNLFYVALIKLFTP